MGTFEEDLTDMVRKLDGKISRGELLAAVGTAMSIGGEAAAALTVVSAILMGGWVVAGVTGGLGIVITPWILQAVGYLLGKYLTLDTEQRAAVTKLVAFARRLVTLES